MNKFRVESVVLTSSSVREALTKLGLKPAGGNYASFKRFCAKNNISISHFTGQAWSKDKILAPKRPISAYLSNSHRIGSHRLKLRLFKDGLKEKRCERCGISEWQGEPAPLELEHINGNHDDNRLENLLVLCPNCHALTSTYRGKNKKHKLSSALSQELT